MTQNNTHQTAVFLTLLLIFSLVCYAGFFLDFLPQKGLFVFGIMWSPGIAALTTRLIFQKNIRGLGWRFGRFQYQAVSYLLPLLFCLIVYGFAYAAELGGISTSQFTRHLNRSILGLEAPLAFIPSFLIMASLGFLIGLTGALGEEIGWRGFLVPELAKRLSFFKTSLTIGLLWSVWHIPGILWMDYHSSTSPYFAIPCFIITLTSLSFMMTWLRLKSGSLWTGVILHTSHNLFIQGIFDPLTTDLGMTAYFTTEFGAGLALVSAAGAFLFYKKRDQLV